MKKFMVVRKGLAPVAAFVLVLEDLTDEQMRQHMERNFGMHWGSDYRVYEIIELKP